MGRILIVLGLAILVIGVLVLVAERVGFRGLQGDIRYDSPRVKVYFPIVTCVVLSILLTLLMWLWNWLRRYSRDRQCKGPRNWIAPRSRRMHQR